MKASPIVWFNVCEVNFCVRGVVESDTRYWHAVAKLDQETLEQIQEFLATNCGDDSYEELKSHLCKIFEATAQQHLDQFLAITSFGISCGSLNSWWQA